jgi:hypothetical protein
MNVSLWPKVKLKGEYQAIPTLCPNCLKPASVELRYGYVPFLSVLSGEGTWFQSFWYCPECVDGAKAVLKYRDRTGWLLRPWGLAGLLLASLLVGIFVFVEPGHLGRWVEESQICDKGTVFVAGVAVFPVLLTALFIVARFQFARNALNRHPMQPGQAVPGPAAYYTGPGMFGLAEGFGTRIYRAARPEWLKALVEANRDQVDPVTYERVMGSPKPPTPDVPVKPFPR